MSTRLYIADISRVSPDDYTGLTEERIAQAKRLKIDDDKRRCITAGRLISKLLPDVRITKNEYGKPIADGDVCFNLSHSGEYVVIAISDKSIGCDIQKIEPADFVRLSRVVFTDSEIASVKEASDRAGQFYRLWTKKESFLKCIGEGFHRPSKSVEVISDEIRDKGTDYFFRTYIFSDYYISVCCEENSFPATIEFIEL